jgi:hypothetical protein
MAENGKWKNREMGKQESDKVRATNYPQMQVQTQTQKSSAKITCKTFKTHPVVCKSYTSHLNI